MNHISIMGRFVTSPTISATKTGKQLCKFTLAVKRLHDNEAVDFIDMLAWENTGLFVANHFKKGQRVAVSGYLTVQPWKDKDGGKHKSYEVIAQNVYFADSVVKTAGDNVPDRNNKESSIAEDEAEEEYQCTDDELFGWQ